MKTMSLTDAARKLGGNSADAYFDEFSEAPSRESVGDWDSSAWRNAWLELKDSGATDDHYDACFAAWRTGFWGVGQ